MNVLLYTPPRSLAFFIIKYASNTLAHFFRAFIFIFFSLYSI